MLNDKVLLITVGTTKFETLIKNLDKKEFYLLLERNKFTKLIIQKGNGEYTPYIYKELNVNIKIEVYDYIYSKFEDIIKSSEYIISPCGAGTVLECLKNKRKFIGVVNESLMNNHQIELATEMSKYNYIYHVQLDNIIKQLENIFEKRVIELNEYPDFNLSIIPNIIYNMLDIV